MPAVSANDRAATTNLQTVERSFSAVIVWSITATFTIAILAAIIGAPLLQASGHTAFASDIYKTFSFACHQISERSFNLAGEKFAVCTRCTGIYTGLALAVLVYPLTRPLNQTRTPRLLWLFLAAAPLAIDWLLGYFSIWQNNHVSRFSTGALLGATSVFYILPGLIDLSNRLVGSNRMRGRKIVE